MDLMCADLLEDILRRLPPRSLAASRCVCKTWHAIVDDHRLLRADLLVLPLDGIIYVTADTQAPRLFARYCTARTIASHLGYLDDIAGKRRWPYPMYICCNGLILLHGHVVNRATQQWAPLGPVPCKSSLPSYGVCECHRGIRYIAYDPMVSPHYRVLLIPNTSDHVPVSTAEWPPSSYIVRVFSSKSMCWKERPFVREGNAAGTVADLKTAPLYGFHSAYWQGALYVPGIYGFILRINLSDDSYQVIKFPRGNKGVPRLGKSMKRVYCALNHGISKCEIWFLDESCGQMEWVLKNEINLQPAVTKFSSVHVEDGPWIIQSRRQMDKRLLKNMSSLKLGVGNNEALSKDGFEWDSDDETMIGTADWPQKSEKNSPHYECLGFHPYKEIVLFCWSNKIVAYHLNSSKIRYLGKTPDMSGQMLVAFTYAPCWMRDLPGST